MKSPYNSFYLSQRFHQVSHNFVLVFGQNPVKRGPSLTVLPQHEESGIFFLWRRWSAVVFKIFIRDAAIIQAAHVTISLSNDTPHTSLSPTKSGLYPRNSVRMPLTSFSPQDLALVLKEKGSTFNSVSGETEPYSLLLLVSSTRTGTGKEMLRRYSAHHRGGTRRVRLPGARAPDTTAEGPRPSERPRYATPRAGLGTTVPQRHPCRASARKGPPRPCKNYLGA